MRLIKVLLKAGVTLFIVATAYYTGKLVREWEIDDKMGAAGYPELLREIMYELSD